VHLHADNSVTAGFQASTSIQK